MKVAFTKTGGFAPIALGCQLDTDKLSSDEATKLKSLVNQSGVMNMADARVAAARDVHLYTIDITDGDQQHKVKFDQLSIPPSVKPLLDFLGLHAKSLMPED